MINSPYHLPVMLDEVMGHFRGMESGTIIDGTLGGGGHAEAFLSSFPGINVIGLDKDPEAIMFSRNRLAPFGERVKLINTGFEDIPEQVEANEVSDLAGVILDLGLSSHQINVPARGFSFMKDGTLDMRFNPENKLTAEYVVNNYPEEKLSDIFFRYGEERNSRRIACAIVMERKKNPIKTTSDLAATVERAGGYHVKTRARIFQALRIEVNDELSALQKSLEKVPPLLRRGGLFAVISYHSLEDRMVKTTFRSRENGLKRLHKKVIRPSLTETLNNPRSRSALLRVAEKE